MIKKLLTIHFWLFVISTLLLFKLSYSTSSGVSNNALPFVSIFSLHEKEQKEGLGKALSDKLSSSEHRVRSITDPNELFQSSSPLAVGLLDDLDWRFSQEHVEAYIQAFVESSVRSGQAREIVLVYRTAALETPEALQAKVTKLAALGDVIQGVVRDMISREGKEDANNIKVSIYPFIGSQVEERSQDELVQYLLERMQQYTSSETSAVNDAAVTLPTPPVCSTEECENTLRCRGVEQHFLQSFVSALGVLTNTTISPNGPLKAIPALALTQANLFSALDTSLTQHLEQFSSLYTSGDISSSLVLASYRSRTALVQLLGRIYLSALDQLHQAALDAFEQSSRRVPTDAKYPKKLRKRSQSVLTLFQSSSDTLTKVMRAMVRRTTSENGLFSRTLYGKVREQGIYPADLLEQRFTAVHAVQEVQRQLAELCTEKVQGGFVSGRYNPYVRDQPFPPVRFSFNYLLNPKALVYSLSYDKLYDEHKDGIATNRAAPLLIPGMFILINFVSQKIIMIYYIKCSF